MTVEDGIGFYILIGLFVCFINGYVRKMEADALLGLTWILAWPMTIIGNSTVGVINLIRGIKNYQPIRRSKIFILRHF